MAGYLDIYSMCSAVAIQLSSRHPPLVDLISASPCTGGAAHTPRLPPFFSHSSPRFSFPASRRAPARVRTAPPTMRGPFVCGAEVGWRESNTNAHSRAQSRCLGATYDTASSPQPWLFAPPLPTRRFGEAWAIMVYIIPEGSVAPIIITVTHRPQTATNNYDTKLPRTSN